MVHSQSILFGIAALVVVPFLTFYFTTLVFYRRMRSNAHKKIPSTIPYYVPGIFHAFSLASTGPQEYIAQLMKNYGDYVPFFIKAGPQPLLIVRHPVHVEKVLTASKRSTFPAALIETFDKLYGSSPAVLRKYAGKGASEVDKAALESAHVTVAQKYLTGEPLSAFVETYISIMSSNLNNKMFQVGTWTQIENSWQFLRQVVTRCILESLLGTDIFKQYPGVIRDYWAFADAIDGFIPGLPRYWVPSAALQARDRLLQGIEKWLKANHSGSEFARIGDEDPWWDSLKGSKFVQERDDVLAKVEGMDIKSRAAEMLSIIHQSNSTLVPCTFWTLIEVLRGEQLAKNLTSSILRYSASQGATYNIHGLTNLPMMESLLAETFRVRTASIVVHTDREDLQLDEHWVAPKNTPTISFSLDLSLNTKAWADTRPRTVEKPLDVYWAERFLVPDRAGSKAGQRGQRNGAGVTSFSMDGLDTLNMGYGQSGLLGFEYIKAMHAATLAVLFNEFELQLCDPELVDQGLPPVRAIAFGALKPLEQIEVRIRKRKST